MIFDSAQATTVASAPSVGVFTWMFLGHTLPDWAAAITTLYTIVLLVILVRDKIFRDKHGRKDDPKDEQ